MDRGCRDVSVRYSPGIPDPFHALRFDRVAVNVSPLQAVARVADAEDKTILDAVDEYIVPARLTWKPVVI